MKKLTISLLSATLLATFSSGFANCPPASSISIIQNGQTFEVEAPAGYTYQSTSDPITATGPISFYSVWLQTSSTEATQHSNVPITKTTCSYGVGSYNINGYFSLVNSDSFNADLIGTGWRLNGNNFECTIGGESTCNYTRND